MAISPQIDTVSISPVKLLIVSRRGPGGPNSLAVSHNHLFTEENGQTKPWKIKWKLGITGVCKKQNDPPTYLLIVLIGMDGYALYMKRLRLREVGVHIWPIIKPMVFKN